MHNFKIANGDTDSITVYKSDNSAFGSEERKKLLVELNSKCPDKLVWEDDGYYDCVIVLKAKNYVLYDGNKIKYKGSSLKSSTLEIALKEFLIEIVNSVIFDRNDFKDIYNKYVSEVMNVKDIKRWASKKTISEKTLKSDRTNEKKIRDALVGTEYVEGDKPYFYFKADDSLGLVENFSDDHNKDKLLEKLYKTTLRFETIMDVDTLFPNYKLKKNKELLTILLSK